MNEIVDFETIDRYKEMAQLFKALAHPARLAILAALRDGEHCVCHLEAQLGLRQAYISQQLMVLRDAGLLQDRREGWNIFYRVARPEIFAAMAALGALPELPQSACACPHCAQRKQADPCSTSAALAEV